MKLKVNLAMQHPPDAQVLRRICILLVACMAVLLLVNFGAMYGVRQRRRQVVRQLGSLSAAPQEVVVKPEQSAAMQAEASRIREILQRREFFWSDILEHLENTWIKGIQVRSMQPDFKDKTLGITVFAKNDRVFRAYLDKLLSYEPFSEVLLLRQEKTDIKDAGGRSLTIIRSEFRIRGGF